MKKKIKNEKTRKKIKLNDRKGLKLKEFSEKIDKIIEHKEVKK